MILLRSTIKSVFSLTDESESFPAPVREVNLLKIIIKTLNEKNLSTQSSFVNKVLQLYQLSEINNSMYYILFTFVGAMVMQFTLMPGLVLKLNTWYNISQIWSNVGFK